MATGGSGVAKASFYAVDGSKTSFEVQYNPKEFKFDKPLSWVEHKEQGMESDLEYSGNLKATMSCELIFDTTKDGSDVRTTWVDRLLSFTNPEVDASGGQQGAMDKKRPPKVVFTWGEFQLLGVFEAINVSYTMFSSDGTPLRAKVSVKMKEWKPKDNYSGTGGARGYQITANQMITMQAGQTLSSVAQQNGMSTQDLAEFNNIDDPLDVPPGTSLLLP